MKKRDKSKKDAAKPHIYFDPAPNRIHAPEGIQNPEGFPEYKRG